MLEVLLVGQEALVAGDDFSCKNAAVAQQGLFAILVQLLFVYPHQIFSVLQQGRQDLSGEYYRVHLQALQMRVLRKEAFNAFEVGAPELPVAAGVGLDDDQRAVEGNIEGQQFQQAILAQDQDQQSFESSLLVGFPARHHKELTGALEQLVGGGWQHSHQAVPEVSVQPSCIPQVVDQLEHQGQVVGGCALQEDCTPPSFVHVQCLSEDLAGAYEVPNHPLYRDWPAAVGEFGHESHEVLGIVFRELLAFDEAFQVG